ncbi:hypothetical protein WME97_12200 [Sorangium sp. So ce367]|uniref:hypothetical protein n=1 Tax=Sorangium sp. So ce367 TaxID=3133305 RepID=UPI003F5DD2DE
MSGFQTEVEGARHEHHMTHLHATMSRSTPLGKTGRSVFPVGLGCMAMSGAWGPAEDAERVAALDLAREPAQELGRMASFSSADP